jgi:hypothetical protein
MPLRLYMYGTGYSADGAPQRYAADVILEWLDGIQGGTYGACLTSEHFVFEDVGDPETFVHQALRIGGDAVMRRLRSTRVSVHYVRHDVAHVHFVDILPEAEWLAFRARRADERRWALVRTASSHDLPAEMAALIASYL